MEAIITGDIVNSRAIEAKVWISKLKECLSLFGNEPGQWEIYRGDSFQLKVEPKKALLAAVLLKAQIKQFKALDIRMAIGIGEVNYEAEKITESNGDAFLRSGECFEQLKKDLLKMKSPDKNFDKTMNVMFSLAGISMNSWTPLSSKIIQLSLKNPNMTQSEMAKLLDKSQSNISIALKRGGFDEIQRLLNYYKEEIQKL
ncbi:SatD family protein [Brumimicrobium aurantiacum]|uniref:Transcriptional regulator n=1 Tax=Brumimicrobium aurantiacum TaxID=1737063 RepID=A0A3E1F0A9_9FLAO|nr:SatD family protein [Brumimicrobium aurantiacum]RFC55238.1 transcriptional regulator [Brumimicrobium aurantiacum]